MKMMASNGGGDYDWLMVQGQPATSQVTVTAPFQPSYLEIIRDTIFSWSPPTKSQFYSKKLDTINLRVIMDEVYVITVFFVEVRSILITLK